MSGTGIPTRCWAHAWCYAPTSLLRNAVLSWRILLSSNAMRGTGVARAPTFLRQCYAMCGTELACGAIDERGGAQVQRPPTEL
eukprot:2433397-Rhodomonas_salina.1